MKKMKKASVFVVGTVFFAVIILIIALGIVYGKTVRTGVIGQEQHDILDSYLKGENAMAYLDSAAQVNYGQTAYYFALNFGFYGESSCSIEGINIINGECAFGKDTIRDSFNKYMNHLFNENAKKYEEAYIPFNNYDFYENRDELIGMARFPVMSVIGEISEKANCFPGTIDKFPVGGSYNIEEDSWGSEEHPDAIRIDISHPNTAVIAVISGNIKEIGTEDGKKFIEIKSFAPQEYRFRYSHLDEIKGAMIAGGTVIAGEPIGSASEYILFSSYRQDIAMNPLCAFERIGEGNEIKGYSYIKPSIIIKPKYLIFGDFNIIMKTAEEITKMCIGETDKTLCVKNNYDNKKISEDLILNTGDCKGNEIIKDKVIAFCVKSEKAEKSFYIYDETTEMPKLEPVRFRFALDLGREFKASELILPEKTKTPAEKPVMPPETPPSASGLIWPVTGTITQCFGEETPGAEEMHGGIDIAAPEGTEVKAAAKGRVLTSRVHNRNYDPSEGACTTTYSTGTYLIIEHPEKGIYTKYSHLSKISEGLKEGDYVEQGQTIGSVGNSGCSTGFHLDFRVSESQDFQYSTAENPDDYLPARCVHSKKV